MHSVQLLILCISISGVASVDSACRCVHLPDGGMLCDLVGCELVYMWNTVPQWSSSLLNVLQFTGNNEVTQGSKQDKGKSHSNKCSSNLKYCVNLVFLITDDKADKLEFKFHFYHKEGNRFTIYSIRRLTQSGGVYYVYSLNVDMWININLCGLLM